MISVKNVEKSYDTLQVLRGVNLDIAQGEIVAIVGKSGAGKSTLLHILGTLDRADKGEVVINGKDISKLSNSQLADFRNKNLGFIFQFHHLLPEFSALENVIMPALIGGGNESKAKKRATELLDYLGLSARLTHKPNELSGGEAQRVAVARALMNNPAVVFADEPTGNLDSASSKDLHDLLFKLRDDFKQTFVIVTHNDELAHLSDRILTMQDGAIK
jgi:lipoprotein-releasing system ATP-binding protein